MYKTDYVSNKIGEGKLGEVYFIEGASVPAGSAAIASLIWSDDMVAGGGNGGDDLAPFCW